MRCCNTVWHCVRCLVDNNLKLSATRKSSRPKSVRIMPPADLQIYLRSGVAMSSDVLTTSLLLRALWIICANWHQDPFFVFIISCNNRQTDERTDRRTNGQTDGRTDRQTDERTDRRTNGQPKNKKRLCMPVSLGGGIQTGVEQSRGLKQS